MTLPSPRAGLVISYAYLWADEDRAGLEEGRKTRPCSIVAVIEGREVVTVVPVTHTPPADPADAIELRRP